MLLVLLKIDSTALKKKHYNLSFPVFFCLTKIKALSEIKETAVRESVSGRERTPIRLRQEQTCDQRRFGARSGKKKRKKSVKGQLTFHNQMHPATERKNTWDLTQLNSLVDYLQ